MPTTRTQAIAAIKRAAMFQSQDVEYRIWIEWMSDNNSGPEYIGHLSRRNGTGGVRNIDFPNLDAVIDYLIANHYQPIPEGH